VLADPVLDLGEALGIRGGTLVVVAHVDVHERGAGFISLMRGLDLL
jgi:hypothetical protein